MKHGIGRGVEEIRINYDCTDMTGVPSVMQDALGVDGAWATLRKIYKHQNQRYRTHNSYWEKYAIARIPCSPEGNTP